MSINELGENFISSWDGDLLGSYDVKTLNEVSQNSIGVATKKFGRCDNCQGENVVRSFNRGLGCPYYVEPTRRCLNKPLGAAK
jgi:hypothetical protein